MTISLNFIGAEAVVDPAAQTEINSLIIKCASQNALYNPSIQQEFVESYRDWIQLSNFVFGLEQFPIGAYSNGTTETFDKFYLKHHNRRFRCFKGEYMYQMACGKNYCPSWKFLDDDQVRENDAVVISYPFSDTGNEHPEMLSILDQCYVLGVPVLIDCAFFGLTGKMVIDITHPAITTVTFSLSKFLPVANLRIGVRFTRHDDDDTLLISQKHGYINRLGAGVGLEIFRNYTPDYNYKKYRILQKKFCNELNLKPSHCVIFGIDTIGKYSEYNRGSESNRLCFSKYFNAETISI